MEAPRGRAVFFDCTPYMAEFFDAPALALVPELELRVARPAAPEVIEVTSLGRARSESLPGTAGHRPTPPGS